MRNTRVVLFAIVAAMVAPLTPGFPQQSQALRENRTTQNIAREVRHQLILLPFYSVFDNLGYNVQGDRVTLTGQVVRPDLKSDAEKAVKSIEGVQSVDDQIEVLPPSTMDDQI